MRSASASGVNASSRVALRAERVRRFGRVLGDFPAGTTSYYCRANLVRSSGSGEIIHVPPPLVGSVRRPAESIAPSNGIALVYLVKPSTNSNSLS